MPLVRNPGSIVFSFVTDLIISPDATSRPQDSAISNTTSALDILPIFRLDDPRVSSFNISLTSARDDWYAGMIPENIVARSEMSATNNSTGGCSAMSMKNGGCVSTMARLNMFTPTQIGRAHV